MQRRAGAQDFGAICPLNPHAVARLIAMTGVAISPKSPLHGPASPCSTLPTWPKSCRATQILSTDTRKRAGRFQEQITKSTTNFLDLSLHRNRIRTWDMNLGSMLARPRLRLFLPSLLSPGGPANNQVVKLPVGPARQIYAPGKIIQRKICLIWRWSKAQKQCKSLGCQTISWP